MGPSRSSADRIGEIRAIAERVAHSHGLVVFDLQFRRESIGWVLRIVIDRLPAPQAGAEHGDSVTVSDCEAVSVDMSAILDVEVTFAHAYRLEVSSPGLDRPLRHLDDFERFIGRRARIVTSEPIDGQRFVAGRIAAVRDRTIVIEDGGTARRVPEAAVARARLEVES